MRFSPTRIVLAALAFVVGAVLALPMLLSRKAEAGDAPPKLEAGAGGGWTLTASGDALGPLGIDQDSDADKRTVCGDDRVDAWLLVGAEPGPSHRPLDALRAPIERLVHEVAAAPPARPWPAAQAIDRQRKYHLRP